MSFPRHRKYKDSGVEWLGDVPEHWDTVRLKNLLSEVDDRVETREVELLGISKSLGVVPRSELEQGASESDNYGKYKIARAGQLVMNKMQAWNGVFGLSPVTGMVSPDYAVFRFLREGMAYYLCTLFKTELMSGVFFTKCRGMGTAFLRLNTGDFFDIKIPVPPPSELHTIAAFLDREAAKIDELVGEQQRLIELLKEKRQAVISHAVTKGLNPHAPMKRSGIEWLGEVPEHWEFGTLKRFWDVVDCKHVTVPFLEEGFPVASVMEVRGFDLDLSHVLRTSEEFYKLLIGGDRQPLRGDIIYCRNTANTGTSAYVWTDEPIAIGQDVVLIKSRRQNGRYLNYILHGDFMAGQLDTLMVGSTFKRINVADIRMLMVVCPPRAEQDEIVRFIDSKTPKFDTLIVEAQRGIDLLRERRTALISAAVTGKIDVRGLVATEAA